MSDATSEIFDLAERARSLAPLLARDAAEAERLRRPTDAVIEALQEAGIFRLMVPRCYGGLELDLDTFLEVGLALAAGDASMAWVTTFYIEHNWMFCQFPESFQRELFAGRDHVLAPAMVAPSGLAEPVDGGFRLDGRWPWGTGSAHGDWVIVGARVENPDNPFDLRFLALPRDEVIVDDNWHTDGMRGTGSNDVVIESRTVPSERTVSIGDMTNGVAPGSKIHEGPLYRTPMIPILSMAASMPALGQARAVVADFRERMTDHERLGGLVKYAEQPAIQMRLARAEIQVRQAELLMREVVAEVMERREQATVAERSRWSACFAWVVHQSREVIGSVAQACGGRAHFLHDGLQRSKRDVDTMSCHIIFDLDQRLESHGRTLLGQDPMGLL